MKARGALVQKQIIPQWIKLLIGVAAAAAVILFVPPSAALSAKAIRFLGCFLGFIIWLIIGAAPDYLSGLVWISALLILRVTDFRTAFNFFNSELYFLLMATLAFGAAMAKSGLLSRLALCIIKMFPKSYKGMVIGLAISSAVINPLIPSQTAKITVMTQLVGSICEQLGIEKQSKAATGLFGAVYMTLGAGCTGVYTGSTWVFVMLGFLSPEVQAQFNFVTWFMAAGVWWIVLTVLSVVAILIFYKPEHQLDIQEDFAVKRLAKMGPMGKKETEMAIVLIAAVGLWATGSVHGVSAVVVGLCALAACVFLGTFSKDDFKNISWTFLLFMGFISGFSDLISKLGVDTWMKPYVERIAAPLVGNVAVFIITLSVMVYISRYFVTSCIIVLPIFFSGFAPLAAANGISSWVVAFVIMQAGRGWPFAFSSTDMMAALAASDGLITYAGFEKMHYVYMVINVLGMLASIPVWRMMGLIV